MIKPREIRRLAFQWLYQLDAIGDAPREHIREDVDLDATEGLSASEIDRAWRTACDAFDAREKADADVAALAPGWPPSRQPAVDRAIFRLAHYEMHSSEINPKTAVNEAVELAKKYSTERSPAFVNGVLDKLLKRVLGGEEQSDAPVESPVTDQEEA